MKPPQLTTGSNDAVVTLDRRDAAIAVVLTVAALAAYVVTLAPELMDSDCAEFYTQAVMLGYAHPTGYPVYLLLAKAATLLPFGAVPYRVDLLSAIMAAAATGLTYVLGRLLTGRRWTPIAGAVALAVSPTFWSQAIIAKVYTSGIAMMLAVLVCLELWRQRGRVRWLFAAGCLGGICLGIHITHSLMAPAVLLLLATTRRRWKANWAVTLAAYWVIDRSDSPTSYFRAVIYPSRSEFHLTSQEMDSFPGRVKLCLCPPQYTELLFSKPAGAVAQKARWYAGNLLHEFPLPWLGLSLAGVYWLGRRNWRMTLLLVLTGATHFGYDLIYDMGGIEVLYLATYVPLVVLAVAGLALLGDGCGWLCRWRSAHWQSQCHPVTHDLFPCLLGLAVVIWPLLWPDAWNVERRRECWVPPEEDLFRVEQSPKLHQQARDLVHDLEPGAVLFTGWCPLYAYYYVAYVEQNRRDLEFIQDYPRANYFELADSALDYVKEVSPRRPVYFTHIVRKVAAVFEMTPVRRGQETLYRVGKRLGTQSARRVGRSLAASPVAAGRRRG
jgi:hypothetical protein